MAEAARHCCKCRIEDLVTHYQAEQVYYLLIDYRVWYTANNLLKVSK